MLRILPTAKFPLKICKGSYEERLALAKKLNHDFFCRISEKFTTNEVSFDVFEKTLKESTPYGIKVKTEDYGTKKGLTCLTLNDNKNAIEGFKILLGSNPYSKGIGLLNTDTSLHETFHFFCGLSNPKHSARAVKMHEKSLDNATEGFYREKFYTRKEFNKDELNENLNKFLKQLTPQEQIEFLQNSRYRLTEEYHCYDEGYKYLDHIQDNHPDLICEKIYGREKEEFNFPEKIKIVADKLKEVIAELRKS